jgi:hypothetical protein
MMAMSVTLLIINKIDSKTVSEMVSGKMKGMETGDKLKGG